MVAFGEAKGIHRRRASWVPGRSGFFCCYQRQCPLLVLIACCACNQREYVAVLQLLDDRYSLGSFTNEERDSGRQNFTPFFGIAHYSVSRLNASFTLR